MTGIYKITNKITGECYVGQSTDIHARWAQHRRNAVAKEKVRKYALYRDIRRYGYSAFEFEILEECKKSELDARENYWILYYSERGHMYNLLYPQGATRK